MSSSALFLAALLHRQAATSLGWHGLSACCTAVQDAARGRYYYLPNASDKAIAQAASTAMADAKLM